VSAAKTPVVLLGGLNVLRALGAARIPAIIASIDRRTPAMASRYCAGTIELPRGAGRDAIAEVLAREGRKLAEQYGRRVPLFYDNEDRLSLVQDYRALLEPHFALLLNEPEIGDALLDKGRFQALAERRGLPVPRRIDWDALESESGPVIAKPNDKSTADYGGGASATLYGRFFADGGKARIFANGREARADPLAAQLAGGLAFQEYIAGGDDAIWSFHGFADESGETLRWFVGRKIRTYPEGTGVSSYLRLADEKSGEDVAELGRGIAARLPLKGVFKMDFKRDETNGRLHLLEINTRFNLWHYLGAVSGVNLPEVAYQYLLKEEIPEKPRPSTRYRWLSLRIDWRAFLELSLKGKLGFPGWLWSLAQAPKVYDLFAWTDPAPFVRSWRHRFQSRWQRLWHSTAS
jgi:predicted ATP-grasp superfamily ATP-dependent carboligase